MNTVNFKMNIKLTKLINSTCKNITTKAQRNLANPDAYNMNNLSDLSEVYPYVDEILVLKLLTLELKPRVKFTLGWHQTNFLLKSRQNAIIFLRYFVCNAFVSVVAGCTYFSWVSIIFCSL